MFLSLGHPFLEKILLKRTYRLFFKNVRKTGDKDKV